MAPFVFVHFSHCLLFEFITDLVFALSLSLFEFSWLLWLNVFHISWIYAPCLVSHCAVLWPFLFFWNSCILYLNVLYKRFSFTVCVICKFMYLFIFWLPSVLLALVAVLRPLSALIDLYVLVLIFICARCCYFIQPVWILFSPMGWLSGLLGNWLIFMNFWKCGDLSFQVFNCLTWVGLVQGWFFTLHLISLSTAMSLKLQYRGCLLLKHLFFLSVFFILY